MATLNPYDPCPCGSGKKFKWCCQPIHEQIVKVFQLEEQGQHDVALKAMDEVVAQHATNPEAWGRKAQFLYQRGMFEESEAALQKAFELNAQYPFGHYLQGRFRHEEGEIAGALILFRRAAQYYDPAATMLLSDIHGLIFDCELKLNHPVAARAALEMAARYNPANESARQALEQVFGPQGRFPLAARQEYKYLPLPPSAPPGRAAAWKKALETVRTGKVHDALAGFQQLVDQDPQDGPAFYNLGLSQAWLGNNAAAVEALEKYVSLEDDENRATQAWTLAEVLRCGQGMEDQADFVENVTVFSLKQADPLLKYLEELQKQHRLVGAQVTEDRQVLTGLILEKMPPALTPELAAKQSPRLGASLMFVGNLFNLSNTNLAALEKVAEEVRQVLGGAIGDSRQIRGPARFSDLFSEAMIFPLGATEQAQAEARIRTAFEQFFEETWLHRPLKSLQGVPPIDASGNATLKKKLRGIVDFLQQCAVLNQFSYDFDRLRRKLGLLDSKVEAVGGFSASIDIPSLGTADLASLKVEDLSSDQMEQAFQTALKMDAKELATKFAKNLISRPARPERPDRFSWFNHLIQISQAGGNLDEALDYLNEAEKDDCEHNEGRRRNDYELRRGQLLTKRGEVGQAEDTFNRLIERAPSELRYQGTAAEAMLSARQGSKALQYAEKGLAGARQQNNRDMEGYFQELVEAARRSGT
jgi:tetratricopeptide (TPR) repeat protein